jgi:hypothetical protein
MGTVSMQITDRTLRWLEYPRFFNPQMPRYMIQIFEQGIFNDAICSAIIGHPVNFRMHHTRKQEVSERTGVEFCDSKLQVCIKHYTIPPTSDLSCGPQAVFQNAGRSNLQASDHDKLLRSGFVLSCARLPGQCSLPANRLVP